MTDTSRENVQWAIEYLEGRLWLGNDHKECALIMRALLDRAEAAEAERDTERLRAIKTAVKAVNAEKERDAERQKASELQRLLDAVTLK